MGAWGEKAFENDSALDWLAELEEEGLAGLRGVLSIAAEPDEGEYLEVDDGAAAIAAAEIVAAARGGGRDRIPPEALAWLDKNGAGVTEADRALARRAVARTLAPGSEVRELWDESETRAEWHADMRILVARLER